MKELEIELQKKEVDIAQKDEKVDKLKDQLFLVTNNKQYDAIMTEIDHLKEKKSSFETDTINLLDEPCSLFLNSMISFAFSSFSVTKNSAPAKAESFIPNISTGIDGKASCIVFDS